MHAPIGTKLRRQRKARSLAQAELARAVGISPSYLNLIEANMGIAIVPDSMRLVAPPGVRFIGLPDEESHSVVGLISPRAASGMVAAFTEAFVREMAALPAT